MVVVVGKPETAESVRELNFRHEFEIGEIHERSVSTIQHQLEQDAEHITHLVYVSAQRFLVSPGKPLL